MSHINCRTLQERARRRALADAASSSALATPTRRRPTRLTPLQRLRRRTLADIASGFEPANSEDTLGASS